MPQLARFGISIDPRLLDSFDQLIATKGYVNRSEAIRDMIRNALVEDLVDRTDSTPTVGTVTLVYDHHTGLGLRDGIIFMHLRAGRAQRALGVLGGGGAVLDPGRGHRRLGEAGHVLQEGLQAFGRFPELAHLLQSQAQQEPLYTCIYFDSDGRFMIAACGPTVAHKAFAPEGLRHTVAALR